MSYLFSGSPGNCCPMCKRGLRVAKNNTAVEFSSSSEEPFETSPRSREPSQSPSETGGTSRLSYYSFGIFYPGISHSEVELFYQLFQAILDDDEIINRIIASVSLFIVSFVIITCWFLILVGATIHVTIRLDIIFLTLGILLWNLRQQEFRNLNSVMEIFSLQHT